MLGTNTLGYWTHLKVTKKMNFCKYGLWHFPQILDYGVKACQVAFGHLTDQSYIIFIAVIYSFKLQLRVWYFIWVRWGSPTPLEPQPFLMCKEEPVTHITQGSVIYKQFF